MGSFFYILEVEHKWNSGKLLFTAWDEPSGKVYYFSKKDEAWKFYEAFNNKYWWKINEEDTDTQDLFAKIYKHEMDTCNVDDIKKGNIIF